MPRELSSKVYASFAGGFVTEANPLSYPENAALDMNNFDLKEDGSLLRREGLRFDASSVISIPASGFGISSTATNVFKWKSVNGKPDLNIAVVQIGDVLDFYYLKDDLVSSTSLAADPITLSNTIRSSASTKTLRYGSSIQVASGGGKLYVVGKYIDPMVLTFVEPAVDYDKGSITTKTLNLKIRDFEIFGEGEELEGFSLAGEKRQDYMSGYHFYNLANQGFPDSSDSIDVVDEIITEATAKTSDDSNADNGTSLRTPATYTNTTQGFFPTTANSFHAQQAGGGSSVGEQTAYSPWRLGNDYTGTAPAPRGKFIKEAFYIRRAATGNSVTTRTAALEAVVTVDEITKSDTRPRAVAFYAGRVWYAGVEGDKFTNNVYFSQVVGDDINKASKCYQSADPTAETINELVATDGGVLNLEEVGTIYKMFPLGPSLAIVADNGVWVISGQEEVASFSATAFSVRKVTDAGAVSAESIVQARDAVYYWGETAMYVLTLDEAGILRASDITSGRIKTFYQQTNVFTKQSSFSVYDEGANRILWFYSDTQEVEFDEYPNKAFNKVLYLDVSLGAFGKYTLGTTGSILPVSAISSDVLTTLNIEEPVYQDGELVTEDGETVYADESRFVEDRSSIKVLTLTGSTATGWSYRFSDFSDNEFTDWGTDYSSYVETGFDSLGDIIREAKKAPIMVVHCERTESGFEESGEELVYTTPSSCLVSYKWDWGQSYGNQFQAYKLLKNYTPADANDTFSYDRSVVTTRNRIRGRGMSFGVRLESESGKDLRLLGYGVVFSNRGRP